jgi:hypothetical protein
MSFTTGTQTETLFAGPPANFAAAAASSSAAQNLMAGATGDYWQPYFQGGFFQLGRQNQLVTGKLIGIVTGQSSATTMIITVGIVPGQANFNTLTGNVTLVASPAITITSLSGVGWEFDFTTLCRGAGYGTSATSTNLVSSGVISVGSNLQGVAVPNSATTMDATNWNWITASVTFSTSSATNSCTLEQVVINGNN